MQTGYYGNGTQGRLEGKADRIFDEGGRPTHVGRRLACYFHRSICLFSFLQSLGDTPYTFL